MSKSTSRLVKSDTNIAARNAAATEAVNAAYDGDSTMLAPDGSGGLAELADLITAGRQSLKKVRASKSAPDTIPQVELTQERLNKLVNSAFSENPQEIYAAGLYDFEIAHGDVHLTWIPERGDVETAAELTAAYSEALYFSGMTTLPTLNKRDAEHLENLDMYGNLLPVHLPHVRAANPDTYPENVNSLTLLAMLNRLASRMQSVIQKRRDLMRATTGTTPDNAGRHRLPDYRRAAGDRTTGSEATATLIRNMGNRGIV